MEDIKIRTADGWELDGSLFTSAGARGPAVLISGATGVPRRFYRHYAQFLADEGASAVLTYDYRGMSGGIGQKQARSIRMADWALQDLPAAVMTLEKRVPGVNLRGIGHSFGGQALGLSGASGRFARYMTIAAGSGYLGFTREAEKLKRQMNSLAWPVAALFGFLPRWAGFGEPIPYGAFDQWRRWCNSPDYFFSDKSVPETGRFSAVTIPILVVGFEDDPWATRKSVEALAGWYANAGVRIHWFGKDELSRPVGHMGFFRPEHRQTLWPQLADWLLHGVPA